MAAACDQEMGGEGLGPRMGDCLDLGGLVWGAGWGFLGYFDGLWTVDWFGGRGGIGWRGCGEPVEKGGMGKRLSLTHGGHHMRSMREVWNPVVETIQSREYITRLQLPCENQFVLNSFSMYHSHHTPLHPAKPDCQKSKRTPPIKTPCQTASQTVHFIAIPSPHSQNAQKSILPFYACIARSIPVSQTPSPRGDT